MKKQSIGLGIVLLLVLGVSVSSQQPQPQTLTLQAPAPKSPDNMSATVVGVSGQTTYYYWIVARYGVGNSSIFGPTVVTNAPNTLSVSNYVMVNWSPTTEATGYDLLRTTTNNTPTSTANILVVGSTTSTSWNDVGAALTSYTPVSTPGVTGFFGVDNLSVPIPGFVMSLPLYVANIATNNLAAQSVTTNAITVNGDATVTGTLTSGTVTANIYNGGTYFGDGSHLAGIPAPGSGGANVSFFMDDTNILPISGNNVNQVNTLTRLPVTTAEVVDNISAVSNTVRGESYLYNTALGTTSIPAGIWIDNTYAVVSSTIGGRVSTLTRNKYVVTPDLNTVTTSGAGASRTATASGGTPFSLVNIDANANGTIASYLQTPQGLYQITARTDNVTVTISVPVTYANEVGVAFSVWKKLFGTTTPPIVTTGTNYTLVSVSSVQSAFTVLATAKLGEITFGTSNNTTTITFTHNGNLHYSNFQSTMSSAAAILPGQTGGDFTITGVPPTTITVTSGNRAFGDYKASLSGCAFNITAGNGSGLAYLVLSDSGQEVLIYPNAGGLAINATGDLNCATQALVAPSFPTGYNFYAIGTINIVVGAFTTVTQYPSLSSGWYTICGANLLCSYSNGTITVDAGTNVMLNGGANILTGSIDGSNASFLKLPPSFAMDTTWMWGIEEFPPNTLTNGSIGTHGWNEAKISGTNNPTFTIPPPPTGHPGIVRMGTGAAADDTFYIAIWSTNNPSAFLSSWTGVGTFQWLFRVSSNVSTITAPVNGTFFCGLGRVTDVNTDNGIIFTVGTDAFWQYLATNGAGNVTKSASTIALSGDWLKLTMVWNGTANTIVYTIYDYATAATATTTINTNVGFPAAGLSPICKAFNTTTANIYTFIDRFAWDIRGIRPF